jgi:hypothetical protein
MTNNGNVMEEWKVRRPTGKEFRLGKLLKKKDRSIEEYLRKENLKRPKELNIRRSIFCKVEHLWK